MSRFNRARIGRAVLLCSATFAGTAALAWIGYAQALRVSGVSVLWPPSGFMLAILVLLARRDWPLAIAAGFLANVAIDLLQHASLSIAIAGSVANAIEVTAAAWVVTRLAGTSVTLTTLRQAAAFVVGSAIASNAVTALAGALVLHYGSGMPFWRGWFVWWIGDGLGMLIVAPAVIAAHAVWRRRTRLEWKSIAEAAALLVGLGVLAKFLLSQPDAGQAFRLDPYTLLPLLFWIAVRTGQPGSVTATILVSAITLWNAAQGRGPFVAATSPLENTVLQIYAYLTVLTLSSLFATALMHEREAAEAEVLNQARRAMFGADVVNAIAGSGHLRETLQRCAGVIARHLHATQVRIWATSPDGSTLEAQASSGPLASGADANVPVGQFIVGRTAVSAKPFLSTTSEPADVDLWPGLPPSGDGDGGFAAYPLILDGRVLGVLAVSMRQPVEPWMADGLSSIADRLAEGIARKRLEDARDQLAALLGAATDFITIGTPEGPPTYLNPAIRTALGIGETEQLVSLLEFRPPGFGDFLETTIVPAVIRDGSWTGETEYIARDGTRIPVSQTSVVHYAPDGRVAFISTISRDIRGRRRMEEALRQSQKMEAVGQLAGGIAHDFNNILTAILGYADVLVDEPLPTGAQRTAALEIRDASLRAARLTRQLLAFGRQQVLQPRVTRLSSVVDELLPMLRRLVGEHIDIGRASDDADEAIFADVTQLEQIVLNLTINASDAMSGGGTLVLRTGTVDLDEPLDASHLQVAPGRYSFLEVKDTGEGMDAETLGHIFEPFFTTKPTGRGTGLGLSTVYGIVKQMRGGIWVYSEPGSGSTFRIYLPRHAFEQGGASKETVAAPPPVVGGTETLLLVEDETAVRTFARRMLERYGYRVLTAANPSEALAVCSDPALEIDLVLTDVRMPGGTGPELVDTLHRTRPALCAMFMSGYSDLPHALTGAPADPRYFLAKPFAGAELAAKVRAILDEER